jgi:hypothetical protein
MPRGKRKAKPHSPVCWRERRYCDLTSSTGRLLLPTAVAGPFPMAPVITPAAQELRYLFLQGYRGQQPCSLPAMGSRDSPLNSFPSTAEHLSGCERTRRAPDPLWSHPSYRDIVLLSACPSILIPECYTFSWGPLGLVDFVTRQEIHRSPSSTTSGTQPILHISMLILRIPLDSAHIIC